MVVLGQSLAQKRFCQFCDFHVVVYHQKYLFVELREKDRRRWIWCSSYSIMGSQYIGTGIDMESRNGQGTPLSELNIQLQ
mgnify:CR=1 FL=1